MISGKFHYDRGIHGEYLCLRPHRKREQCPQFVDSGKENLCPFGLWRYSRQSTCIDAMDLKDG